MVNIDEIKEWVQDNRLRAWTPQMIIGHLIAEIERLQDEVDNWKRIASQINTDWIPANKKTG